MFNAAHTKLDRNFSETILGIYRDIFEDKGNDKKKNAFLENGITLSPFQTMNL